MVSSAMAETAPSRAIALRFGIFEVNLAAGELRRHGLKVSLRGQPFTILSMLLEKPGEIVTRQDLRERLWPSETFVDFEHSVNSAVKKLRGALGDTPENSRYIETIPRVGYRFIAPVEAVGASETAPPTALATKKPRRVLQWSWNLGLATAIVVAVSVFVAFRIIRRRSSRLPTPHFESIAVLPLKNLSGDPAQQYIADGMTDELITDLAKIHSLNVISATSSEHFKGNAETVPQIAKELHADAVVEGSVVRSGEKIRVTAQLIDARHDRHLWADSYERNLPDLLTLQSEVAQEIAQRVQAKLTPEERDDLARPRPVNPLAYQAYLMGTYSRDELSEESIDRSVGYFNEAIKLDPNYAPGYAGLSHSYYVLGVFGYIPSAEAYDKAGRFAAKALELDPSSAEAYNTFAEVKRGHTWDWNGAEADYKRAIELQYSYPNAHSEYALLLSMLGRHRQAIEEVKLSVVFDPLSGESDTFTGFVLYRARRYREAIDACSKGIARNPDFPMNHWFLSLMYTQTNQMEKAVAESQQAVNLSSGGPFLLSKLGYAYGAAGDKAKAEKVLGRLRHMSHQRYVAPMAFAWVYVGLGDKDAAMEWIGKAFREHDNIEFLTFPAFDPLRSDPRFEEVMRSLHLPG